MWLINSSTGRLKWHDSPSEVRYAILSHVWRGEEQTFQELRAIMRERDSPREHTSEKIRRCCIYAERDGYEWLWVDACCINKESSAELSEAINSMFAWYAQAGVCYAFLDDVREDEDHREHSSSFSKSRWWERGWTLQELIAPKNVVFLAKSWVSIGTKLTLADEVERISGVDRGILLGELSLNNISVARRMSWASKRRTTRIEDRAYSLLGIFGVHLSTIYGEGGHAFIRLQEEIIKTIPDQSIFAWGPVLDDYPLSCKGFATDDSGKHLGMESLLAPSPEVFVDAAEISPITIEKLSKATHFLLENPSYSFTSYGCHATFPIIDCQLVPHLSLFTRAEVFVALLACEHREKHRLLGLLLRLKPNAWKDYYVGQYCRSVGPPVNTRGTITALIDRMVHPGISDTPMNDTRPEYHRIVSLAASFDHVGGLASVRRLYIHTSSDSLDLERSRESASGPDVRRAGRRRWYEEAWLGTTSIWSTTAISAFGGILLPLVALSFIMPPFFTLAFILPLVGVVLLSFGVLQVTIFFKHVERRPFPFLRLQPIPALETLRLLNAPCRDYVLVWAWWHLIDPYLLLLPLVPVAFVMYLSFTWYILSLCISKVVLPDLEHQ